MSTVMTVEERIASIEAILPTLATKADMSDLRADFDRRFGELHADMERGQKDNRTWMLGTVLALFVGIIGTGSVFIRSIDKQQAVSGTQPIIIYATPPAVVQPDK